MDINAAQARVYGDHMVRQPAGFLCGDKEIALAMNPGALERQRRLCADLRVERIVPGAGHWIQQERPEETSRTILAFLDGIEW
jgi:pimeloyl-ACP methyl ester carboxylesterase